MNEHLNPAVTNISRHCSFPGGSWKPGTQLKYMESQSQRGWKSPSAPWSASWAPCPPCPQLTALSATSRSSLDTSRCGDSNPPWAGSSPDYPSQEEIPPEVQPKPPLAQLGAIFSPPVLVLWDQSPAPCPAAATLEALSFSSLIFQILCCLGTELLKC